MQDADRPADVQVLAQPTLQVETRIVPRSEDLHGIAPPLRRRRDLRRKLAVRAAEAKVAVELDGKSGGAQTDAEAGRASASETRTSLPQTASPGTATIVAVVRAAIVLPFEPAPAANLGVGSTMGEPE